MTKEQKEVLKQALSYLTDDMSGWNSEHNSTRCNDLYEKVFGKRLVGSWELTAHRVGADILCLAIDKEGFFAEQQQEKPSTRMADMACLCLLVVWVALAAIAYYFMKM